ncbi:MAG: molybdopterin-dependent oxidoreductase [Xanthobacteraceae bacterium]
MPQTLTSLIPGRDRISASKEIVRTSGAARQIERRLFLKQSLSLGALTLLTGCDVTDTTSVQRVLNGISDWNDRTQAAIFNPRRLMPTYPESAAVKDFRYNAYFGQSQIPKIDGASYRLNLSGLVDSRKSWTLDELYALPQESQVTRHVCVEGWSMIGKWTGVPFRTFLQRIGADTTAKYVGFECADGYYSSIDMASALHPQTFLTFKISDEILAPRYGYPLKLRIPTKLGFKNPKWITAMYVTNRFPGGFWEDRGYNWFGGV